MRSDIGRTHCRANRLGQTRPGTHNPQQPWIIGGHFGNLMRELRRKRGIHANPWAHFLRLITSVDNRKRERPETLIATT